jgi:HD-like signal output (HDOD) protein
MMDARSALDVIADDAAYGDIVFPTHSEMALRVQRLLDDPECTIEALSKLIGAEPILATRVLAIANSIAYTPGGRTINEVKNAVSRLGFATLRALAATVIVRQMKDLSPAGEHRQLANRLWEHTASVASLARVLAHRVTRQNPDAAFFAGIVHEIGSFYLIARADDFPGLLTSGLERWHDDGEAVVGRAVLHALHVPAPILEAQETLWSGFLAMPPASLGDTLLLADQLSPLESPINALAGMSRKGMSVELELLIDNDTLTSILTESAEEVASLCAALKS